MKLNIIDWSDSAYARVKKLTGKCNSEIVATIEVDKFDGFSYDGGRLEIQGYDSIIWVSHQFSIRIADEEG